MAKDDETRPEADPESGPFRSTAAGAAPQPRAVDVGEDGPELTTQVSDHKHRYQRFRVLGERRDPSKPASVVKCVVCNHEKGSRS